MRSIVLALVLASGSALAAPCTTNDAWTGPDKAKHFGGGAAIASAVVLATGSKTQAIVTAAVIAGLKEAADRRRANHACSFQDFAVTVAGGVAGAYGTSWVVGPNYIGFTKRF